MTQNLSTKNTLKLLLGGAGVILKTFEDTKPVNQSWDKIVVGRCRCYFEDTALVNQEWGKLVVGRNLEGIKLVNQNWGKLVVRRCRCYFGDTKTCRQY